MREDRRPPQPRLYKPRPSRQGQRPWIHPQSDRRRLISSPASSMLPYPPRFALPNLNCGELRNLALFSEFKVKFAKPPIKKQKSRGEEEPAEWRRKRRFPLIFMVKSNSCAYRPILAGFSVLGYYPAQTGMSEFAEIQCRNADKRRSFWPAVTRGIAAPTGFGDCRIGRPFRPWCADRPGRTLHKRRAGLGAMRRALASRPEAISRPTATICRAHSATVRDRRAQKRSNEGGPGSAKA